MCRMSDVVISCHIESLGLCESLECRIQREHRATESLAETIDTREHIGGYDSTFRPESTAIDI